LKREGDLFHQIIDIDNLRLAFWKARKGKDYKTDVIQFRAKLDENLLLLKEEIEEGKVVVGDYHYFNVYEPKERNICASSFRERVLHHAIMNVCHANFTKFQISNSFASQKGKGTYAAIEKAKTYQKKYDWYLKLDVRKYFDKVDHLILKKILRRRFKEHRLLHLFDLIIDSYRSCDLEQKGIPIGNLTSQYFANHYLGMADHFVTEQLKLGAYVRYMDDMVLWSNNKSELLQLGRKLEQFIKIELALDLKPFCLNKSIHGLPFLGYNLFPNFTRLRSNSKKRFQLKLKKYVHLYKINKWSQSILQNHLLPLYAFVNYADSDGFKQKVLSTLDSDSRV